MIKIAVSDRPIRVNTKTSLAWNNMMTKTRSIDTAESDLLYFQYRTA
jgi:hypothetical protein